MPYVGVIVYSYDNCGQLIFLLGRESMGPEAGRWSDFGGAAKSNNIHAEAAREFYEETMGFLGEQQDIYNMIATQSPVKVSGGHVFFLKANYDASWQLIQTLFSRFYNYGAKHCRMCSEGWFEKSDIQWFTMDEILDRSNTHIRPYFRKIIRETFAK